MFVEAVRTDCPDDLGESVRPVVLMIDEVDSAANNQVFLDFLSLLRRYYLNREKLPAFHSVIMAGVYDIKNLKLKLRPDEESKYNSPWNIAEDFNMDLSFNPKEIAGMLMEYETDYLTGMDISAVSQWIYGYKAAIRIWYPGSASCLTNGLPIQQISWKEKTRGQGKAY